MKLSDIARSIGATATKPPPWPDRIHPPTRAAAKPRQRCTAIARAESRPPSVGKGRRNCTRRCVGDIAEPGSAGEVPRDATPGLIRDERSPANAAYDDGGIGAPIFADLDVQLGLRLLRAGEEQMRTARDLVPFSEKPWRLELDAVGWTDTAGSMAHSCSSYSFGLPVEQAGRHACPLESGSPASGKHST